MTYQHILFSLDGGIARITLNRPDRLNSFNVDMHMNCATPSRAPATAARACCC